MSSEKIILDKIDDLLSQPYKNIESELGIKIVNGQSIEGIRKSLTWVKTIVRSSD